GPYPPSHPGSSLGIMPHAPRRRRRCRSTDARTLPRPAWLAGTVSLVRLGILQRLQRRAQHDVQVHAQRPVAQVLEVVPYPHGHLVHRLGLAARAVDLGPAGDARLDLVPDHVALDELAVGLVVGYRMRPWADHAHAPLQHVEELRQFVERGAAQEPPERRDAVVVAGGLADVVAVLGDLHRAELPDDDLAAVQAVATLAKEHRPGHGDLDG